MLPLLVMSSGFELVEAVERVGLQLVFTGMFFSGEMRDSELIGLSKELKKFVLLIKGIKK